MNIDNIKNHIEEEFLKSLSYKEINEIMNGFNERIVALTAEREKYKAERNELMEILNKMVYPEYHNYISDNLKIKARKIISRIQEQSL